MTPTLVVRALAEDEITSAIAWMEGERPGYGALFKQELDAIIDTILRQPNRYPVNEDDVKVREAGMLQFPYTVYYRERGSRIIIMSVYHQSRDPEGWKTRR